MGEIKDTDSLNEFRRRLGLPIYEPATVKCLGIDENGIECNKDFLSYDKRSNRLCPTCRLRINIPDTTIEPEEYWDKIKDVNIQLDPEYWDFINDI